MNDSALLRLLQLFDSQFPVGHFAFSQGIETYAYLGMEKDGLRELLLAEIDMDWGRLDLAAAALAWTHAHDAARLNALGEEMDAWKVIEASRQASTTLGRRAMLLAARLFPADAADLDLARPHQAIVIGVLGKRTDIPLRPLLLAYAQSQVNATLASAVRCMSLSPEQAQGLLVDVQPAVLAAVGRVIEDPEASMFCSAPALDIRRHQQKDLPTRLFKS